MKSTGIIMSGNHPTKVMDGNKTMTRRTWGLKYINEFPDCWEEKPHYDDERGLWLFWQIHTGEGRYIKCPYGQVGDLLWMKETWLEDFHGFHSYYADYFIPNPLVTPEAMEEGIREGMYWKKPSLFLKKCYSRATLDITGLRPERIQDITEEDAKAEGIDLIKGRYAPLVRNPDGKVTVGEEKPITYRHLFTGLWDSINEKRGYGWDKNPWVWAITFRKIASAKEA